MAWELVCYQEMSPYNYFELSVSKKTKTTKGKKRKKADYSNMKASWSREVNQTYLGIEEVKFWLFIKAQLKDRAVRIITGCDDIFTCN